MECAEQRDVPQQVDQDARIAREDPIAIGGEFALEPPERHAVAGRPQRQRRQRVVGERKGGA
jgi:hypothetical protein